VCQSIKIPKKVQSKSDETTKKGGELQIGWIYKKIDFDKLGYAMIILCEKDL